MMKVFSNTKVILIMYHFDKMSVLLNPIHNYTCSYIAITCNSHKHRHTVAMEYTGAIGSWYIDTYFVRHL